jgi:hypothetical protein
VIEGAGQGEVAHDGQPKPRSPRSGTRRLRDISHLYLSNRPGMAPPTSVARRCLRIAVLASGDARVDSEVCANLAIQMTRLGRKTIVLDADAALPNPGFRLGLHPLAYLNGLVDDAGLRVERGVLGIGVVNGTAWALAELDAVLRATDAVLVRLPMREPQSQLQRLAPALALPPPVTTMERAATQSPMFEAWMKTARRGDQPRPAAQVVPAREVVKHIQSVDAAIRIFKSDASPALPVAMLGSVPVHGLEWGPSSATQRPAWARVPAYALHPQLALAVLEPDHPAVRVFEGLAQALLAGLGRGGPAHV